MSATTITSVPEKKSRSRAEASLQEPLHVLDRVPPHSIDAEQALLASCIIEGGQESITTCIEGRIRPESFYKPSHRIIFRALLDLYESGTPVDEIILAEKLQAKGQLADIGGHLYINEVTDRISTPAHLPHYLERVRDTALLRRLIRTSQETIERAFSGSDHIEQFIEAVEQEVFAISEDRIFDSAKSVKESIDSAVNLVNLMLQRKGELTGVTTGFADLDKMTFGWHGTEMIVVAARPSMGKTSLALNMAEAVICPAGDRKPVATLMFSLEMGADQLAMRLLCSRARVNMSKLKDGFLPAESQRDLVRAAGELKKAPLWIDDSGHMSILEMRAKARRVHAQRKLGLVIIDYLQLVSGTDPKVPREQQISEISRGVKAMAKELNVPVIVLAQLNRESEKERRQPRLSDLRESGAIEQDADVVLLLSKRLKDYNEDEDRQADVVMRDLIIAKQRNGPVGVVPLAFTKNLTRFENYTGYTDS